MFKFVNNYKYRRQLKKAREDLQTIFDEAARRRTNQGWDKFRDIEDFMRTKEQRVYRDLLTEEWALSKLLGITPEWGHARALSEGLGPDSPVGFMTVRENRSTKVSYEYVELVDMMVRTINGKWSSVRWDWETVDKFRRQGWGRNQAFHDAVDEWHAAETPEAKQEVIDKYKEENPQWSL